MLRLILLCLALLPALPAIAAERITVFAAASLQESLDEIGRLWTERSGQRVVLSYAASSALARQIEQGAPADVFVSADQEWMDYLQQRQLIVPGTRFDLVSNRLVLVMPTEAASSHFKLSDAGLKTALGAEGRLAIAETSAVPAGRYARQALEHLGLWETVAPRLAEADNVRAALAFVARGEAPVGIVYLTDALAEPRVRVRAEFSLDSHAPIRYPAASVSASPRVLVDGFLVFLRGEEARAVFRRTGFGPP